MSLGTRCVPVRRAGSEATRLGRELVVLDAEGKMLRGLNPSGARVWELIDGARCVEQIADQIADEYELPPGRALTDVLTFLEALSARRLVTL
jgi:pyrroloquinoline quinone biosynthesis protein D